MSLQSIAPPDWRNLNTEQKSSVIGIYDTKDSSKKALDKLIEQGFTTEEITLSSTSKIKSHGTIEKELLKKKAIEGASAGAATGAVIGGTLGWLIGIGAFTLSTANKLPMGGPITSAIAGLLLGTLAGAIGGALIDYFLPDSQVESSANEYTTSESILLSIKCANSDVINHARKLLETTGAHDIASFYETN